MYNKALSKKIITVIILAVLVISILLVLIINSILKTAKLERNSIKLDDVHIQALTDAGFTATETGYIKEDISMSFQIYTKGTKENNYPHVSIILAGLNEDFKTEHLMYDALNKVYYYETTDNENKIHEIILDENLEFMQTGTDKNDEDKDSKENNELREIAVDRLEKFYKTFGLSIENTLGFECPAVIENNAKNNTTFGMQAIQKLCTETEDEGYYTYKSQDGKLEIQIYPNGGESYNYPYLSITNKILNVNSTLVPMGNSIVCSYSQDAKFINVAYDFSEGTIILYKEGGINKTELLADDAVVKSKIKEIYETEVKNIQSIFNMNADMLLAHNEPFDFSEKSDNDNTLTEQDENTDNPGDDDTNKNLTEEEEELN